MCVGTRVRLCADAVDVECWLRDAFHLVSGDVCEGVSCGSAAAVSSPL